MKRILSLCVLLMATGHVYAQKQLPGYFISNTYDTVHVVFNYYPSDDNPKVVNYIANGIEKKLTPGDCEGFSIPGYANFLSKDTKRLTNPISLDYLPGSYPTEDVYENINTFLQIVFSSPSYTLYEFHDAARVNYFLEDSAGNFVELKFKVTMNGNAPSEKKVYIGQLKSQFFRALEQNKAANDYVEQLAYTRYDLVTFLQMITGYSQPRTKKINYPNVFVSLGSGCLYAKNMQTRFGAGAGIGSILYIGDEMGTHFVAPQLRFSHYSASSGKDGYPSKNINKADLLVSAGQLFNIRRGVQWFIAATPNLCIFSSNDLFYSIVYISGQTGVVINKRLCISVTGDALALSIYLQGDKNVVVIPRALTLNIDWRFHL